MRDVTTTISPEGEEETVVVRMPDQSAASNPERSVISREVRQSIVRALGSVTPRERAVFELKHYHGMRLRTVAGMLRHYRGYDQEHIVPCNPQAPDRIGGGPVKHHRFRGSSRIDR